MEKIFLKWMGSKTKELDIINNEIKDLKINNFYEPFVGGGSVFLNMKKNFNFNNLFMNDKFKDLYYIYKYTKEKK